MFETSVAVAQKVVELLSATVTGIPGEAKATALPVALVPEQLELV